MIPNMGDRLNEEDVSNSMLIDRGKVRILLCDNDPKSCHEALELLCKCSYQVTAVKTPRQVIDALNAEGKDIDIILSEVDLPVKKGFKLLKYITREKELQRIPIIMMSSKDEVSFVVKCLRLGAADYLVKPLRTNELLNLWTHMWRRRRMLGLAEKNILNHEINLPASDPSDTNTNSTTLFSDDTEDKKSRRNAVLEANASNRHECDSIPASTEPELAHPPESGLLFSGTRTRLGVLSCPRRTELKIGESSAFFTYTRSNLPACTTPVSKYSSKSSAAAEQPLPTSRDKCPIASHNMLEDNETWMSRDTDHGCFTTRLNFEADLSHKVSYMSKPPELQEVSGEEVSTPSLSSSSHTKIALYGYSMVPERPGVQLYPNNSCNHSVAGTRHAHFIRGMPTMPGQPAVGVLQGGSYESQPNHAPSSLMHSYNNGLSQYHNLPLMGPMSYYPLGINPQVAQMETLQGWLPASTPSMVEEKPSSLARREAALAKFRNKRKDRCFDKKIRYVNRKKLAENRPRIRGQFVRQAHDAGSHSNGRVFPNNGSDGDDDDEDEDGPFSSEQGADSAPECESEF